VPQTIVARLQRLAVVAESALLAGFRELDPDFPVAHRLRLGEGHIVVIVRSRPRRPWEAFGLLLCAAVWFAFAFGLRDDPKARDWYVAIGVLFIWMGIMSILDARDTAPKGATRRERWTHIADTKHDAGWKGAASGVYLGTVVGLVVHSAVTGVLAALGLGLGFTFLAIAGHSYRQRWINRREQAPQRSALRED